MLKSYIRSLYKRLLSEGSLFFDDRARTFIINRTKKSFQEYKTCQDQQRIKHKIKEARRHLHFIESANRGGHKRALKILEEAYGRSGKTRHLLLAPYLSQLPASEPFVPHAPRTAPPPTLSPVLSSLIKNDLSKAIEPTLPVPLYKPLHVGRKANLLWRYRSMLLDRIQPPLPMETVMELEKKASNQVLVDQGCPKWDTLYKNAHIELAHLSPHNHHLVPLARFQRRVELDTSPFHFTKSIASYLPPEPKEVPRARPYTDRQKRRLYQRLLEQVPLLDGFDGTNMWDTKCGFKLLRSKMAIGCKFDVVEIPEDVVERMKKGASEKKKRDKKPRGPDQKLKVKEKQDQKMEMVKKVDKKKGEDKDGEGAVDK